MADGDDIFDGGQLRRELMLEVARLNGLAAKFFEKAMNGDGDVASGTLYVKISERKSTLLGLNAPQSQAVQVIHEEQRPRQLTSTERARQAIDQLRDEYRRKNPEEFAEVEAVRARHRALRGEPEPEES